MKRELKGFVVGVIITLFLLSSVTYAAGISQKIEVEFNSVNISVNGQKVLADNILYNGTTYVPLRAISEILGKDVVWDGNTNTANINDKISNNSSITTNNSNEARFVNNTWQANIDKNKLPFSLNAKNGMSLTVNDIYTSSGGIRINITLTNNSTVSDKGMPMTSTWEFYDGKSTLKFLNQDRIFYDVDEIRCGQSITGNVNFSGLTNNTDNIILYGALWQYIDAENFKISIKIN